MTERRQITHREIIEAQDGPGRGGWSRELLNSWGVPWPSPEPSLIWRSRLVEYGIPYIPPGEEPKD